MKKYAILSILDLILMFLLFLVQYFMYTDPSMYDTFSSFSRIPILLPCLFGVLLGFYEFCIYRMKQPLFALIENGIIVVFVIFLLVNHAALHIEAIDSFLFQNVYRIYLLFGCSIAFLDSLIVGNKLEKQKIIAGMQSCFLLLFLLVAGLGFYFQNQLSIGRPTRIDEYAFQLPIILQTIAFGFLFGWYQMGLLHMKENKQRAMFLALGIVAAVFCFVLPRLGAHISVNYIGIQSICALMLCMSLLSFGCCTLLRTHEKEQTFLGE